MKHKRLVRKIIKILIILVIFLRISVAYILSGTEEEYYGKAPSPSGKYTASYDASYIPGSIICLGYTSIIMAEKKDDKTTEIEEIFYFNYVTSPLLEWKDDNNLNIIIPVYPKALTEIDLNRKWELSYHVQKFLPKYKDIKITLNGKNYAERNPDTTFSKCFGSYPGDIPLSEPVIHQGQNYNGFLLSPDKRYQISYETGTNPEGNSTVTRVKLENNRLNIVEVLVIDFPTAVGFYWPHKTQVNILIPEIKDLETLERHTISMQPIFENVTIMINGENVPQTIKMPL